jgi:hypothetical protein
VRYDITDRASFVRPLLLPTALQDHWSLPHRLRVAAPDLCSPLCRPASRKEPQKNAVGIAVTRTYTQALRRRN